MSLILISLLPDDMILIFFFWLENVAVGYSANDCEG